MNPLLLKPKVHAEAVAVWQRSLPVSYGQLRST
jgi:hypothetical protein